MQSRAWLCLLFVGAVVLQPMPVAGSVHTPSIASPRVHPGAGIRPHGDITKLGVFDFIHQPAASKQDTDEIILQTRALKHFFELVKNDQVPWQGLSSNDRAALNSVGPVLDRTTWYPVYGCATVCLPEIEGYRIVLIGLDGWEFRAHSGAGGPEFVSQPKEHSAPLSVGELPYNLMDAYKAEAERLLLSVKGIHGAQRSAASDGPGHQKTPAFLLSLLQDALESAKARNRCDSPRPPKGGFTDVGLHTGGAFRHTTWPLAQAVLDVAIHNIYPSHTQKLPSPHLARQAVAHTLLWLLEEHLRELEPLPRGLNEGMTMLAAAAGLASSLEKVGVTMHGFAERCEGARIDLAAARAQRADAAVRANTLPDLKACMSETLWRSPAVVVPRELQPEDAEDSLEAARKRAGQNLEWEEVLIVVPSCNDTKIYETFQWMKGKIANTNLRSLQLQLRTLESLLFSLTRLGFDNLETSDSDVTALLELVSLYSSRLRTLLSRPGAEALMQVQLLGRETLVKWIAFCIVHRACVLHEPILDDFGVGLVWSELDHLVLDDKTALFSCLRVCDYLRRYKKGTEVFSLRRNEDSLDLAFKICTHSTRYSRHFRDLLNTGRAAASAREAAYWSHVERKKTLLKDLRAKIFELREEEASLEAELFKATIVCDQARTSLNWASSQYSSFKYSNLDDGGDSQEWRDLQSAEARRRNAFNAAHTQETIASQRLQSKRQSLRSHEGRLPDASKPPPALVHNLPAGDRPAFEVLFFTSMPQLFQYLSEMSFCAQEALLPSRKRRARTDQPSFYPHGGWDTMETVQVRPGPTSWGEHVAWRGHWHNECGQHSLGVSQGSVRLRSSSQPEKEMAAGRQAGIGPSHIDDVNQNSNGIWFPDLLSREMTWHNSAEVYKEFIDPFQASDKQRLILTHTEELQGDDSALQWAVPMLVGNPKRENWPFAAQDIRPKSMTKREFITFGTLRANELLQLRKLCIALKERFLPLRQSAVQTVVKQLLFQTGELRASTLGCKLWTTQTMPFWKSDLADDEFMSTLLREVQAIADEVKERVCDHEALQLLGEVTSYLSGFDSRFGALRRSLAETSMMRTDEKEMQMKKSDPKFLPDLRTKQRFFCLYAILCFGAGTFEPEDCAVVLSALLMSENGAVLDKTEHSQLLNDLTVRASNVISGRLPGLLTAIVDNPGILTLALRKTMHTIPSNLQWVASKLSYGSMLSPPPHGSDDGTGISCCFEAVCPKGHLYTVNILTGMVLFDGRPLSGLPMSLRNHQLYIKTFAGCDFEAVQIVRTAKSISDRYHYDFFLVKTSLVVREHDIRTNKTLELLDPADVSLWGSDLPQRLHVMHSHWLCREEGVLVLRGIGFRSSSCSFLARRHDKACTEDASGHVMKVEHWDVYKVPERLQDEAWGNLLNKLHDFPRLVLVDTNVPRSPAPVLLQILSKFEKAQFVHVFNDSSSNALIFEMPRFGNLAFSLRDGQLVSLGYRGYVLAPSQTLPDTLYEFSDYLILKLDSPFDAEGRPAQLVLMPDSEGRVVQEGAPDKVRCSRVSLHFKRGPCARIRLFCYDVHPRLQHLQAQDNSARLQLAALFAATSTSLPEQGVGMLGEEHAIELVRQSWKNSPLSHDEATHLREVVAHTVHSSALALVCRDLVKSAMWLQCMHAADDNPEQSQSPASARSNLPCDTLQEHVSAYQVGRKAHPHHSRRVLTDEEERSVLGAIRSTPMEVRWPRPPQEGSSLDKWQKSSEEGVTFASHVESLLVFLSGDVGNTEWHGSEELRKVFEREEVLCGPTRTARGPLQNLSSICTDSDSVDRAFPLRKLAASASMNKTLGKHMMQELEESWNAHMRCKASTKTPVWTGSAELQDAMFTALLRVLETVQGMVVLARRRAESDAYFLLESVPDTCGGYGRVLRMMQAADQAPQPKARDLLGMLLSRDQILYFNPMLCEGSLEVVSGSITAWAVLCVLEDKMERLFAFAGLPEEQRTQQLVKEMHTTRVWSAENFPEWLVLEVEGRLQIRPKQYQLAKKMIDDECCGGIFQLNMGEGKTRVVLPMVWLHQSRDKKWLVRANFLPTLLHEARDHLLRFTSASVFFKRLYVTPFHRDVEMSILDIEKYDASLAQCLRVGGLLIVAPEHRNSMSLKAQEWHLRGAEKQEQLSRLDAAHASHPFFDVHDESDVILHHNNQLVYACGNAKALPDAQSRWMACESVLRVMCKDKCVREVLKPPNVCKWQAGASPAHYPRLQLIPGVALDAVRLDIMRLVATRLVESPPYQYRWLERTSSNTSTLVQFMTDASMDASEILPEGAFEPTEWADLLALCGVLAHGTMLHCLKKRFRVDYGLKEGSKKRLAVPYRASDTPSDRSEFAQPDCALMQTYLSTYWDGLTDEQMGDALGKLMSLGDQAQESFYNSWFSLSNADMQDEHKVTLSSVRKVDLTNSDQLQLACRYYKHNYETINFFLAQCVLPSDTQQFAHRLVSSAWNLAQNNEIGATVGFSGTNDHHRLLPLQVHQAEAGDEELLASNGKMLDILLRNEKVLSLDPVSAEAPEWMQVVNICLKKDADALLDAGGLLAGRPNRKVAAHILQLLQRKARPHRGVTFFDVKLQKWKILGIDGQEWQKNSCPIPEGDTFALFDESRCRGADLKLKQSAKAVVTLGVKMGKDKLMQAAGRMRRLEEGQSLLFVCPSDVSIQMKSLVGGGDENLTTLQVLEWVMLNNVKCTEDGMTSWAEKGSIYATTHDLRDIALLDEKLELAGLYAPALSTQTACSVMLRKQAVHIERRGEKDLLPAMSQLMLRITSRAKEYGRDIERVTNVLDDECERELELEEEEEEEEEVQIARAECRAQKKWEYAKLLGVGACDDLQDIVRSAPLHTFLAEHVHTYALPSGGDRISTIRWPSEVFCTRNFFFTVIEQAGRLGGTVDSLNEYLRPAVMAWRFSSTEWLLLSDMEANGVLRVMWSQPQLQTSGGLFQLDYVVGERCSSSWLLSVTPNIPLDGSERKADAASGDVCSALHLYNGDTAYPEGGAAAAADVVVVSEVDRQAEDLGEQLQKTGFFGRGLELRCAIAPPLGWGHSCPTHSTHPPSRLEQMKSLLSTGLARQAAVDLVKMRGRIDTLAYSHLESIVGRHNVVKAGLSTEVCDSGRPDQGLGS